MSFFWFLVLNLFFVFSLFIFSFLFCWGILGYLSGCDLISYGLILLNCEFVFLCFCPENIFFVQVIFLGFSFCYCSYYYVLLYFWNSWLAFFLYFLGGVE